MDENNINEEFDALTESVKLEKLFQDLANRAELAQLIAVHSARVYKAARKSGLPRREAGYMAKEYWNYEVRPADVFVIEGEKGV